MGAVAEGIDEVRPGVGVVPEERSALELDVGGQQARVDDVCVRASAACIVVDVVSRAGCLVGDAAEAPGGPGLSNQLVECPDRVCLDGCYLISTVSGRCPFSSGARRVYSLVRCSEPRRW